MGTIVTINQDADTPARREITPAAVLTYLYDRSRDSKKNNAVGQDFITYCYDDRRIVFAVCDGVSQSFYGDMAARFLGEELTRWLFGLSHQQLNAVLSGDPTTSTPFTRTDRATKLIQSKPLSANLPPMVRDALLRKRENGSETMFVAGLVDLESKELTVFWMGDMRLWLWDAAGDSVELPGAVWDTKERWSTRVGPKNGKPRSTVVLLEDVARITVHSDGIGARAADLNEITLEKLNQIAHDLGDLPASDDLTILDIALESVQADALPAPHLSLPHPDEPVIQWEAVEGAEWYRVWLGANDRYSSIDVDNTTFFINRAEREDRPIQLIEGQFDYRVQAMASDRLPGEGSEPVKFERPIVAVEAEAAHAHAEPVPIGEESRPVVTNRRPFRVDPLMVVALLMALLMTVGWYLMASGGH